MLRRRIRIRRGCLGFDLASLQVSYVYTYIRFILDYGVFPVRRGVSDMYLLYLSMVGLWLTYVARLIYRFFHLFF